MNILLTLLQDIAVWVVMHKMCICKVRLTKRLWPLRSERAVLRSGNTASYADGQRREVAAIEDG